MAADFIMQRVLSNKLFPLLCVTFALFASLRSPTPCLAAGSAVIPTHGDEFEHPAVTPDSLPTTAPAALDDAAHLGHEPADAATVADDVDVSPLARLTVQHNSTLKTFDTFARQAISAITGRGTLDGRRPTATLFDMSYRPWAYADRDLIKIGHLPVREEIADALGLTGDAKAEQRRQFLKTATISLQTYHSPTVQAALKRIESSDLRKVQGVNELRGAAATLEAMLGGGGLMPPARFVPPAPGTVVGHGDDDEHDPAVAHDHGGELWHTPDEIVGNAPALSGAMKASGMTPPAGLPGYAADVADRVVLDALALRSAWQGGDVTAVNEAATTLAAALEAVNIEVYPSPTKRNVEVFYNRLAKLTLPGAALYCIAFAIFLVSAYSSTPRLRLWGLRFMLVALLVHTAGIGVRWWLVEKSTNDWFHSIPIKNQFESVMFSAWFGAALALVLEMRRRKPGGGLFGAAGSFVGWLSLLALFASPFVFGKDIGGEIKQASGILMSYWLYIHVTMVTASYALIGMSFLLAAWWLFAYYTGRGTGTADDSVASPVAGGGFLRTLGRMVFLPIPAPQADASAFSSSTAVERPQTLLARLDAANLVILQLAFWILGAGVVFGAVWADMSWGRPWGWDPKETFALVTWIVYLIVLHVRLVTPHKAWWTAVLAFVGFFVMLFNWIGVNFFFVGLHSYA